MPALSSSALVLHNLGMAAGFGGTLFGRYALHPAVREIPDERRRGEVVHRAWQNFGWVNAAGVATAALTWLTGRSRLTGREIDRSTRQLVVVKDVLLGTAVACTALNMIGGSRLGRSAERGDLPVESGNVPSSRTPPKESAIQTAMRIVGPVGLAAMAGVIGVTALLNFKAGTSHRWSLVSRLLP